MDIKFEYTDVYGFHHALRGMRNALESWGYSDSEIREIWVNDGFDEIDNSIVTTNKHCIIGKNDFKLAVILSKAGQDHGKYLRQIQVWVDIIAPMYWWKEFDTYKIGNNPDSDFTYEITDGSDTVINSTSQMHKLGSRFLTFDDFAEDLDVRLLDIVNEKIQIWRDKGKVKGSKEWLDMIKSIPQSYIYRRTINTNYAVLQAIDFSERKYHKLDDWKIGFIDWIDSLPYSGFITLDVEVN